MSESVAAASGLLIVVGAFVWSDAYQPCKDRVTWCGEPKNILIGPLLVGIGTFGIMMLACGRKKLEAK